MTEWERVTRLLRNVIGIFVWISAAFGVAGFFGGFSFAADTVSHFRPQYAAVAVFALVVLRRKDYRWTVRLALFSLIANAACIAPWYLPQRTGPDSRTTPAVRIVVQNVLTANRKEERLLAWVRAENPDIVVLLEVNEWWVRAVSSLRLLYPYSLTRPRDDNFGIAVYSRLPMENLRIRHPGPADVPSITGNVTLPDGRQAAFIATHPVPPGSPEGWRLRNEQLDAIRDLLAESDGPAILAGDLNTTVFSPIYQRFARKTGLLNARAGRGLLLTWLRDLPQVTMGLDHIMARGLAFSACRVGPDIGSDHRGLVAELYPPSAAKKTRHTGAKQ